MENIIQMLGPLIIVILISLLSNSRRRKAQQRDAARESDENAMSETAAAPPPFMEDFPFETQLEPMIPETDEEMFAQAAESSEEPELESEEPTVETPQPQPPPVPVDAPTRVRPVPGTSLLDLSPQTFRQGIILSEILGRPKTLRARRNIRSE